MKQRPGKIVVMDNLSGHKPEGVKLAIESVGVCCVTCRPTGRT